MENTCKKCNETKDVSLFVKNKRLKKGVENICNKCKSEYYNVYFKKNYETLKNKNKERCKKYRVENAEKLKEYNIKNSSIKKEYDKKRRLEFNEKIKLQEKEYRLKNNEAIKDRKKEYYFVKRAYIIEKSKNYYSTNSTSILFNSKIILQNDIDFLNDSYVKKLLTNKGFERKKITPELIEIQRIITKTKRLCKTSKI